MFNVNIPDVLKDKTCPQPTDEHASAVFQRIKSTYPHADVTEKGVKAALLLERVCELNYEQAHFFVETTTIYEEHRGELEHCYYKWVRDAGGNPQKAVNKMVSDLMDYAAYAREIAATGF